MQFKCAGYDFTHGAEMLTVLNALKKFLFDNHSVEFPFYEKGLLSYYQKRGDSAGVQQIENALKESTFLHKVGKKINWSINKSYDAGTINAVGKKFDDDNEIFGMVSGVISEGLPYLKAAQMVVNVIDNVLTKIEQSKLEKDSEYIKVIEELRKRETENTPEAVKEYLPTLFAKDISYWLSKNNLKLVVFLDTYENLTGDEKDAKRHEKLTYEGRDVPVDWWVETLLNETRGVLWVIAGRSEIKNIGEELDITKGNILFPLTALEDNFADEFLIKSGVEDSNLRGGIVKLTGGYPNYLQVCVDTYREILANGNVPTLADFGDKREKVINRLLDFMNDTTRNMVKRLCILGTWTDIFATRVLITLHENNRDTYNRVKKLSFVTAQTEKIFAFDKSIQKILFDHLKNTEEDFIFETRDAANKFFYSAFYEVDAEENKKISADDRKLFFKFWHEIILRTTDGAEYLMKQFDENLFPISSCFDDAVIEGIIEKFQAKIEETDGAENVPHAYFEHLLAQIKLSNRKVKDALELAESAYNKFESLPLKNNFAEIKISVIRTLADVYKKLKRTAAEIELREKFATECEKFYRDKTDENIIDAKYKLADAFKRGDKRNKALELYAEIYRTLEPLNNERTMDAANYYAAALEYADKYKDALPLREKVVAFYRNTGDDDNLLRSIYNLVRTLKNLSLLDNAEKILQLQREIITLKQKVYSNSCADYFPLENLYNTLKELNRADEAKRELENYAEKLKSQLDAAENLYEKVAIMGFLSDIAEKLNNKADARNWEQQRLQTLHDIIAVKIREPIEDFDAAIDAIKNLQYKLSYEDYREKVSLQRKLIELLQKNPAATEDEIISAKGDLANILARNSEGYSEAQKLREEIVEYYKAKYPDDETHEDILCAMSDLAGLLECYIKDYNAALIVLNDIYRLRVQKNDDATNILEVMNHIAWFYFTSNNDSELLKWRKNILNFCRENFVADSPEVIRAMEELSGVYEDMNEYDAAENLRREIADIKGVKRGDDSNSDVISAKKQIANRLYVAGKYDEELKLHNEIVELCRKNHAENGGNRHGIISALDDVAILLDKLGREDEVIEMRRKIVKEYKDDYADIVKNLGETSDDAIDKLENIAYALNIVGDYEEELKYRKKIVELRIAADEFSDNTVRALESLAYFYSETGDEAEEFKTRQHIVEIRKEMLKNLRAESDDDEEINIALYALATAENDLGNFDEGAYWEDERIANRRRAVEKFEHEFGRTDSETINALKNLADDLDNYHLYDEELKVRRDILARLQEISPDEFTEKILAAMSNLADLFKKLGDYRAVLQTRREIVKIYKEEYPDDECNEGLINARRDEAKALLDLGDNDGALAILRENVELYAKCYGENGCKHDVTINAMDDVARLLEHIGDLDGAIAEREKILALLKEKYPANHEKVIVEEEELDNLRGKLNAENIENVEDVEVADEEIYLDESEIKSLQEKLTSYREIFGNEHSRTLKLRDDLARDLEIISRTDEAAKLREENLTAYEKIMNRRVERFGESHEITLDAMRDYANTLHKLKRYDDAEKILRRVYEIYSEKYRGEKTNGEIITALENLVLALETKGDLDAAVVEQNKLVGLLKEKFAGYEFCQMVIAAQKKLEDLHVAKKNFDAEKISVSLRKGQKYDLTKNHPQLSRLTVNFSWDAANNFEIDHSAFLLGANGKLKVDEDFIFYNNSRHESGGVEYIEKPAQIKIDLAKIPDDVIKIALTLTIYDADVKAQNFSQVTGAYISIVDAQIDKEILRFDLQENFSVETAIVAGEIYRYKGAWKFNAVGAGFIGGLESLCKKFSNSV